MERDKERDALFLKAVGSFDNLFKDMTEHFNATQDPQERTPLGLAKKFLPAFVEIRDAANESFLNHYCHTDILCADPDKTAIADCSMSLTAAARKHAREISTNSKGKVNILSESEVMQTLAEIVKVFHLLEQGTTASRIFGQNKGFGPKGR